MFGRSQLALTLHKLSFFVWFVTISFFVWFVTMSVHVLWHARALPTVLLEEWSRRSRHRCAALHVAAVTAILRIGVGIALLTVHLAAAWSHRHFDRGFGEQH